MPTKEEALVELYRRGTLSDTQKQAVEELARRGKLTLPTESAPDDVLSAQAGDIPTMESMARDDAVKGVAQDVGPFEAALIGMGSGFATVGRGLGLMAPEDEGSKRAMAALEEERTYSTGAGEIAGQVLPFLAPGLGTANLATLPARVGAGALLGGAEGGVIARGEGKDVVEAAGLGAGIGAVAEVLFPVIGRLGRQVYQRVTGATPKGALLDAAGRPTPELQAAMDQAGIKFEDLTATAQEIIQQQRPGAVPDQVSRAAMFGEEGVPISRGELTKEFDAQAVEQRLMESAADASAEPFRQFKLRQSQAIQENLARGLDMAKIPEETGELMVDALAGRKKLLRTQKNELYREAAEAAEGVGGVPIMANLDDILPNDLKMRGLNRASGGTVREAEESLMEYGLIRPTDEMIEAGFVAEPLTVRNVEDLRQTLKALQRKDPSGATDVYVGPIIDRIDNELDEVAANLEQMGYDKSIVEPLKQARKTVRQLKTEFSPQAITGKLVDVKKDGVTPVVEASKVYDRLSSKGMPVENVRRTVDSLLKAGEPGQKALASLQTTTMLDLINAGFGTKSRQISGIQTFNPIAFRNRIDTIGKDKLASIFKNDKATLNKIMNFEKIAKELTPPAATQPKGSASVIGDYMNRLGILAIGSKLPGGPALIEGIQRLTEAGGNRRAVEQAINASPEVQRIAYLFDDTFPGIASALGVSGYVSQQEPLQIERSTD